MQANASKCKQISKSFISVRVVLSFLFILTLSVSTFIQDVTLPSNSAEATTYQYIRDISFHNGTQCNISNYLVNADEIEDFAWVQDHSCNFDLNKGAGGRYISMSVQKTNDKNQALSDISSAQCKHLNDCKNQHTSEKWTNGIATFSNLNQGTAGDYIYLSNAVRGGDNPILDIAIVIDNNYITSSQDGPTEVANVSGRHGADTAITPENGWSYITNHDSGVKQDFNASVGGAYIYIAVRHAVPPKFDYENKITRFVKSQSLETVTLCGREFYVVGISDDLNGVSSGLSNAPDTVSLFPSSRQWTSDSNTYSKKIESFSYSALINGKSVKFNSLLDCTSDYTDATLNDHTLSSNEVDKLPLPMKTYPDPWWTSTIVGSTAGTQGSSKAILKVVNSDGTFTDKLQSDIAAYRPIVTLSIDKFIEKYCYDGKLITHA